MSSTLSINNLTCQYEKQVVLESLNLSVEKGEIVCLLGASGCGKTTLLKAIAGLIPLSTGKMSLNDQLLDDGNLWIPPEKRNIGMIFQDYALFPHLTVAENISFGLKGVSASEKQSKVEEMLSLVHLDGYGDRYPHQLSGGQQQRVAIARSLAYHPDLLLLDEPFSNIDTQVRHDLIREIRKIFKSQGVTAIFVTHSREEAFAFADKMAVMNHGVIEQFGSASELYYQPSSKFVADFLGGGSYLAATMIAESKFKTVLGEVLALPRVELVSGQECTLLLRPQHVIIRPDETSETKVLEQQFMGDHCRYVIKVGKSRLIATSYDPLSVGDKVSIELDQEGILAFA
ncbi:ABC transporter ATP-binding protein [Vibrio sp. HN007]|uniref:ABC transporter ATP-binding protein n=1 Tax=Vibrio iocasae TaxID=3098914 RepID=UPI0035D44C3D